MANEDVKPVAEPSAAEPNTTLTPSIREQWNQEHMPKTEKSATPDAPKAAKSEGKPESATESETVKEPQEKGSKKLTADERIAQLEATIEKIRKSAGKAEPKQAEETKAEPVTRQPVVVKAKLEAPKEPDMKDPKYAGADGWEKYEADIRQYTKDLAKYEAAVASKDAVEQYKQEQLQKQQAEKVAKEFAAAEQKYPDYKEKSQPLIDALIGEMQAAPEAKTIHPVILEAIGSNPLCADILYVLGPNKDEFLALARSNPVAALEKVAVIKHLISEEFAKAKPAESKEPKEEKKTPVETVTRAPKPPSEVGGRATTADDEGQQAAKSGDFRSAKAAWTRDYVASNK
jgi:hypothetical protein